MQTTSSTANKSTKTKIMDAAEAAIIQGGFNAFSFRDIAETIGIKSASVHYHYPTKEDLVASVMARYTAEFTQLLVDPRDAAYAPERLLNGFIDGFKHKIVDQHNMSLCTMLTSDKRLLPAQVSQALADFYQVKLTWLAQVCQRLFQLEEAEAQVKACQILASLHGASILVQATGDPSKYEDAVACWRCG